MIKNNYKKYKQLSTEYKYFIFDGYSVIDNSDKVRIVYNFNLGDKYFFNPSLEFHKRAYPYPFYTAQELETFAFNIGMIELISYWKAACPPKIIIKPFRLNSAQVEWWKKVYYNGLGEFFYMNKIPARIDDFVEIISESDKELKFSSNSTDKRQVIVPVGGGKDSIVTLELLKSHYKIIPLILNPRRASIETTRVAGFSKDAVFEIDRTIDPLLLQLNDRGFLNGHTPFSALLAFVSLMAAFISGSKYIALSNESSANEPTHPVSGVNHQYSKSYEFEKDFREYTEANITRSISYFSFLRPVNELSIASIFSGFPHYFDVFKSCNVGSKTDAWCGTCPKCLFTYIILSPFLKREVLIDIFGKDLLNDPSLSDYFNELIGMSQNKPFECVGTIDEVNVALSQTIKKNKEPYPYLLAYYETLSVFKKYKNLNLSDTTGLSDKNHFLNHDFLTLLKASVHGRTNS